MFGLTNDEERLLKKFKSPQDIQDYLDRLPVNFEKSGDTHYSPRLVIRHKKAHCIEGALLAATALWLKNQPPLLLDLKTKKNDDEHVVALFKMNGYWGALSKTNHAVLRYRDPIYKTIRELALSYYHEYFMPKNGEKTLMTYSRPYDLRRLGHVWITDEEPLWYIDDALNASRHYALVPKINARYIRKASLLERNVSKIQEWTNENPRT